MLFVERHVPGFRNGARHQFLSGARGARDQRGKFAHARVERAPVAAHVVSEDRLPDGGTQPRGRHRAADDIAEYLLERALDLPETGEGMARIVAGGEMDALDFEEATPVVAEACVKAPAGGIGFVRRRAKSGSEKVAVVTGVEERQDRV